MADEQVLKERRCGIHALAYISVQAGCPACRAERKANAAIEDRDRLQRELDRVQTELTRVKGISDLAYAMKNASNVLDDSDRVFLKDVLYRWRAHKSVDLAVLPDNRGFSVNDETGFRQHHCTSVGGIAMASSLQEAFTAYGRPTGMNMLMRGMSDLLQGGTG